MDKKNNSKKEISEIFGKMASRMVSDSGKEEDQSDEGKVVKALPNSEFEVLLANGRTVIAHPSGRIRRKKLRISINESVVVVRSPKDWSRGRISEITTNRRPRPGT